MKEVSLLLHKNKELMWSHATLTELETDAEQPISAIKLQEIHKLRADILKKLPLRIPYRDALGYPYSRLLKQEIRIYLLGYLNIMREHFDNMVTKDMATKGKPKDWVVDRLSYHIGYLSKSLGDLQMQDLLDDIGHAYWGMEVSDI